uniref:Ig-like domain-containing protein n=1 Tax=Chelonoidis abingdonii TaxID=106734 RepID=A0A8C0IXC8_CHEAB
MPVWGTDPKKWASPSCQSPLFLHFETWLPKSQCSVCSRPPWTPAGPSYEATEVPINQVNGIVHGTVYLNPKQSVPEKYKQITWWFNQSKKSDEDIQLDVYEPIPKPRVNITTRVYKDGECKVTLECTVAAIQVTYRWCKNEKDLVGKNSSTLDVELKSESDASYKCIVSNPVSEETGFIYYRSPCTWNGNIHFAFVSLAASIWLWSLAMQPLGLGLN